jgi:hypothetical protein
MSNTDPPPKIKNDEKHGSPSQNKKTISKTDTPPKAKNDEQHGSPSQKEKR